MISTIDQTQVKLIGLSTDTPPTDGIANGSSIYLMDTNTTLYFDAESETWVPSS